MKSLIQMFFCVFFAPIESHPTHIAQVSALSTLPTRGSHRIKQSLQLAQKLMEKHRACESLQKMVAEKEAETEQVCCIFVESK
jgi:hypothetical protein